MKRLYLAWRAIAPFVLVALGAALILGALTGALDVSAEAVGAIAPFFAGGGGGFSGSSAASSGPIGGDTSADRINFAPNVNNPGGPAPFGWSWPAFGAAAFVGTAVAWLVYEKVTG